MCDNPARRMYCSGNCKAKAWRLRHSPQSPTYGGLYPDAIKPMEVVAILNSEGYAYNEKVLVFLSSLFMKTNTQFAWSEARGWYTT